MLYRTAQCLLHSVFIHFTTDSGVAYDHFQVSQRALTVGVTPQQTHDAHKLQFKIRGKDMLQCQQRSEERRASHKIGIAYAR